MKTNKLIFFPLGIILVLIVYNLYKNDINNNNVEHFGILDKLNNKNRKRTKENYEDNDNKSILKYPKAIRSLKTKSGSTFEDILRDSESIDPDKFSYESMKKELIKYYRSFNKEKFKNNSKSTSESFEKYSLYKEKFFELFK